MDYPDLVGTGKSCCNLQPHCRSQFHEKESPWRRIEWPEAPDGWAQAAVSARQSLSDVIGRPGGDEFVLLLWNLGEADALMKAAALESAIAGLSFVFDGSDVTAGASAGVALLGASTDATVVLAGADGAMYARKKQRRGGDSLSEPYADTATSLHRLSSYFILGYHGRDRQVAETLLKNEAQFQSSENDYDWLGWGIYTVVHWFVSGHERAGICPPGVSSIMLTQWLEQQVRPTTFRRQPME